MERPVAPTSARYYRNCGLTTIESHCCVDAAARISHAYILNGQVTQPRKPSDASPVSLAENGWRNAI